MRYITILLLVLIGLIILAKGAIAQPYYHLYGQVEVQELTEKELTPLLIAIQKAESGGNPTAQNPTSTAGGLFQFIDSSWENYGKQLWGDEWVNKDKYNAIDNTELALYAYQKDGYYPWCMSMYSWTNDHTIHAKCIDRYTKYGYEIPKHY